MREQHTVRRADRPRAWIAAWVAAALAMAGVVVAAPASAAEPTGDSAAWATEASVTSVAINTETTTTGSLVKITARWSLTATPDAADALPAGFTIDLPEVLSGQATTFAMVNASGTQVGSCAVDTSALSCRIDDSQLDVATTTTLSGTVSFWSRAVNTSQEIVAGTITVNDVSATVEIKPPPTTGGGTACTADCPEFTGQRTAKGGSYSNGRFTWTVTVPAPADGMAGGEEVRVTDSLSGSNMTWAPSTSGTYAVVQRTNTYTYWPDGERRGLTGWTSIAASTITDPTVANEYLTIDGDTLTAHLTAEAGYFYRVVLYTAPTDFGLQSRYTNQATVTVDGTSTTTSVSSVTYQGGTATLVSEGMSAFRIVKLVEGDAAGDVPARTFTGTFTVTDPQDRVTTGAWVVGQSTTTSPVYWTSAEFPAGSTVVITEDTPQGPVSIAWGAPSIAPSEFTTMDGGITTVTVTNTANAAYGDFEVTKVVEGPAGAIELLEGMDYVVEYTVDGVAATPLMVEAGETTTSPQIRAGSQVELTEVVPAVDGIAFGEPEFSRDSLTVEPGETVGVTLTNPVELTFVPGISIIKTDAAGNDANTAGTAVTVEGGAVDLVFTVANTGDEPLTGIEVSDRITAGAGTLTGLACEFPDGSIGTSWAGVLAVGASFECSGTVSGLVAGELHADTAMVTATGVSTGTTVTDEDPYFATRAVVEVLDGGSGGTGDDAGDRDGADAGNGRPSGVLSSTGLDALGPLGAASALVLLGAGLFALGRSRRQASGS